MTKTYFLTTPIYYVNDRPHIGHTYTTVLADVLARHRRMMGEEVYFLTGTDEHGQKIEKAAAARGITPKALADEVVPNFEDLWTRMGLTHDHFVRTTHARHKAKVQEKFLELAASGDIFKDTYTGLYSVSDEAYVTETQAKEMQAQGLAHQLVELEEESYFFRLSSYEHWLLQLYDRYPEFVQPDFRLNEVKQFVAPGGERGHLQDVDDFRRNHRILWRMDVREDRNAELLPHRPHRRAPSASLRTPRPLERHADGAHRPTGRSEAGPSFLPARASRSADRREACDAAVGPGIRGSIDGG